MARHYAITMPNTKHVVVQENRIQGEAKIISFNGKFTVNVKFTDPSTVAELNKTGYVKSLKARFGKEYDHHGIFAYNCVSGAYEGPTFSVDVKSHLLELAEYLSSTMLVDEHALKTGMCGLAFRHVPEYCSAVTRTVFHEPTPKYEERTRINHAAASSQSKSWR